MAADEPLDTIVFDTSSGISIEEQQEILAGIDAMAGGRRLVPGTAAAKTKKKGFLFPLFVNVGALIILGAGFALLFLFHGQDEQSIRESSATLGLTERKLIQEIRQETNRQIDEKENEINDILSKLSEADTEYRGLQASVESLTEAQKDRAAALLKMQEEYHSTLSGLQEEKDKIIEDSRQQEVNLRTQAEERAGELSSQIEESQASLGAAMEELRRLTNEQDLAARVEAQMDGYYTAVNEQINAGHLDEAAASLRTMRDFLDAPSLRGIRSLEARKQSHLAAIAAMEGAVAKAQLLMEADASQESAPVQPEPPVQTTAQDEELADMREKYAALEQKAAEQERAIAAFGSQGSEQDKKIAEYVNTITGLQSTNADLQSANAGLQSTNAGLQSTNAGLETANTNLQAANANQQNRLNQRDSEVLTLRAENAARAEQVAELNSSQTDLRSQLLAANDRVQKSETALDEQKKENDSLIQERETLQRELLRYREAARQLLDEEDQ